MPRKHGRGGAKKGEEDEYEDGEKEREPDRTGSDSECDHRERKKRKQQARSSKSTTSRKTRGATAKKTVRRSTSSRAKRSPATPQNHKHYKPFKRGKLRRQTSGGTNYNVRLGSLLKNLGAMASTDMKTHKETKYANSADELDSIVNDKSNVIRVSTVIGYTSQEQRISQTWAKVLDKVWNSGLETIDNMKQRVSQQPSIEAWLKRTRDDPSFQALKSQGINIHIPDDKKLFQGKSKGSHAAAWAHSEVACASDPALDGLLNAAILQFVSEVKNPNQLVIREALIVVYSYPNSMCGNACRFAMDQVGKLFAAKVKAKAEEMKARCSPTEAWGTVVGGGSQFGPQLTQEFHKLMPMVTNDGISAESGGQLRLEQACHIPKESKKKSSGAKLKSGGRAKLRKLPSRIEFPSDDSEEDGEVLAPGMKSWFVRDDKKGKGVNRGKEEEEEEEEEGEDEVRVEAKGKGKEKVGLDEDEDEGWDEDEVEDKDAVEDEEEEGEGWEEEEVGEGWDDGEEGTTVMHRYWP